VPLVQRTDAPGAKFPYQPQLPPVAQLVSSIMGKPVPVVRGEIHAWLTGDGHNGAGINGGIFRTEGGPVGRAGLRQSGSGGKRLQARRRWGCRQQA